jgi:hypothetical protein
MSIQWGRVFLVAFVMELALFAIAVPLFLRGAGQVLLYVIPPAALIFTFAITVWIGQGITSNFVLHGVLIGIVGTLIYVGVTRAGPEPWQYLLAHALKVVGGIAGGMVLARRKTGSAGLPTAQ